MKKKNNNKKKTLLLPIIESNDKIILKQPPAYTKTLTIKTQPNKILFQKISTPHAQPCIRNSNKRKKSLLLISIKGIISSSSNNKKQQRVVEATAAANNRFSYSNNSNPLSELDQNTNVIKEPMMLSGRGGESRSIKLRNKNIKEIDGDNNPTEPYNKRRRLN